MASFTVYQQPFRFLDLLKSYVAAYMTISYSLPLGTSWTEHKPSSTKDTGQSLLKPRSTILVLPSSDRTLNLRSKS